AERLGADADAVPRWETQDPLVEGARLVGHRRSQMIRDARLIQPARDLREGEEPLDLRGKGEGSGRGEVVEGSNAHAVPGTVEDPSSGVPDGKREVSQQVLGSMVPPAPVGAQDELIVSDLTRGVLRQAEGDNQVR